MKRILVSILFVWAAAGLSGCFSVALAQDMPVSGGNELVAAVPADTLFYIGATRNKALEDLMAPLRRSALQSLMSDESDLNALARDHGQAGRFLKGLVEAYAGLAKQGKTIPGVAQPARVAIYTIGIVPVARIPLSDAVAFRHFLDEAQQLGDAQAVPGSHEKIDFRTYRAAPENASAPGLLVAVRPDYAVITVDMRGLLPRALPVALGLKAPEQSLAQNKMVQELVSRNGFRYSDLAFINQQAVVAALTGAPGSLAAAMIEKTGAAKQMAPMWRNPACQRDLRAIAADWPITAIGVQDIDDTAGNGVAVRERAIFRLTDEALTRTLGKLRGHIPAALLDGSLQPMVGFALGLNMSTVGEVLVALEQRFLKADFHCRKLVEAQQRLKRNDPTAMFLAMTRSFQDVRGVSLSVFDMGSGDDVTKGLDAMLVISTQHPRLLFKAAKAFAPSYIGSVHLPDDGSSVALFPGQKTMPPVRMMISGSHLAAFMGPGASQAAKRLKEDKLTANGVLYSHVDFERLLPLVEKLTAAYADYASSAGVGDDTQELQRRVQDMPDFNLDFRVLLDMVKRGITLDMRGTVNPPQPQN